MSHETPNKLKTLERYAHVVYSEAFEVSDISQSCLLHIHKIGIVKILNGIHKATLIEHLASNSGFYDGWHLKLTHNWTCVRQK